MKVGIMNYRSGNTLRVLQLWGSACYQHIENLQGGSPQQKHLGTGLLVRRLFGGAPVR